MADSSTSTSSQREIGLRTLRARAHIGWEHSFVREIHHFLTAIAEDGDVAPHGATFEDGCRAAEVCDAIVRWRGSGRRGEVAYR